MKQIKSNPWKMTTILLTAVLGGVVAYQNVPSAFAGKQPHMEAALKALTAAQTELKAADDDKGGFRAKALVSSADAITQTQKGIDYANTH